MKNTNYEIIVWWSDEDESFVVEAPELPGCMAHGQTRQEATTEIEQAIELWLETAKEDKITIPVPAGRLAYA